MYQQYILSGFRLKKLDMSKNITQDFRKFNDQNTLNLGKNYHLKYRVTKMNVRYDMYRIAKVSIQPIYCYTI